MNPDLFWVPGPWHGRLAVIGRPRGGDWLEDEVSAWRRAGLDVIVSLLEAEEAAQLELLEEEALARSKHVQFVSFPIPDRGVPASTKDALSLFAKIGRKLDGGENVAIHCRQSVGRSGMVAAGLLITAGMGVDKAIEAVSAARGQSVPETVEQLQWIRHLPAEQLALAP
jgi:protein-tyrosine phosphatase